MKTDLDRVIEKLKSIEGVRLNCDFLGAPSMITWIDAQLGSIDFTIEHRPGVGFGLYTADDDSFGSGPDEVYRDVETLLRRLGKIFSPEKSRNTRQHISVSKKQKLIKGADEDVNDVFPPGHAHLNLRELREILGVTQSQLAEVLGQRQSAISMIEGRNDVLLSTLFSWIRGLGGNLEIKAHFSQCDLPVVFVPNAGGVMSSVKDSSSVLDGGNKRRWFLQERPDSTKDKQDDLEPYDKSWIHSYQEVDKSRIQLAEEKEEIFMLNLMSNLSQMKDILKLSRIDENFRVKTGDNTIKFDAIAYGDGKSYLIEVKTVDADEDVVNAAYELDHYSRLYRKYLRDIDRKIEIRRILAVPSGITQRNAVGSVVVLMFDAILKQFTNMDEVVGEFIRQDLKSIRFNNFRSRRLPNGELIKIYLSDVVQSYEEFAQWVSNGRINEDFGEVLLQELILCAERFFFEGPSVDDSAVRLANLNSDLNVKSILGGKLRIEIPYSATQDDSISLDIGHG